MSQHHDVNFSQDFRKQGKSQRVCQNKYPDQNNRTRKHPIITFSGLKSVFWFPVIFEKFDDGEHSLSDMFKIS